jgi:DNA invertase Pin-like site-specific DNA recombinase
VVIVHDIDQLTRNVTDWNGFEKACVRRGVPMSAYTGRDLDLSTAEGAYYGGMEALRARRECAVKSARVREAEDREARKGRRVGGGERWFGYTRIYANPDEPNHKKRHIVREEINPVEAEAIRDAGSGCWSTGSRSPRSCGTGPPAASRRSRPGSGGRPRSWAC